jgi:putative colanic acid biosynthesis acetyltransferase WcaF
MNQVNNALYKTNLVIGASKLKQLLWYFTNVLVVNNSLIPGTGIRVLLLRAFGARVGKGVVIKPAVNIKYPWKLVIGDHAWIGERVWIDNLAEVTIGSSACLSQGCFLLTGNHDFKKAGFDLITASITIEEGVWIGAAAIVCPGVTCGSHAVLTVASIATKNLEPYCIYKGNPAIKTAERVIH